MTPLTAVAVADGNAVSDAPDGSWSGTKAFDADSALQDAIDALAGTQGGGIPIAPGTYDEELSITECSIVFRGLGVQGGAIGSYVSITGTLALNASDSLCSATLENLTSDLDVSDDGTGANFELRQASSGPINITGALTCHEGSATSTTQAGTCTAENTTFTGATTIGAANNFKSCTVGGLLMVQTLTATNSTFAAVATGAGTSTVKGCTFTGAVQFDLCDAIDSRFTTVTGDGGGGLKFRSCLIATSVDVPVTWDGVTERASLAAGCAMAGDFVLALDPGQAGPAQLVSGNTTITFNNPVGPNSEKVTRAIVLPDLAANATVTLDETGGVALQPFYLDCWHRAHTITVKDSTATTIDTIAANTAGNGTRNLYQIDATTGKVVKVAPRQAL